MTRSKKYSKDMLHETEIPGNYETEIPGNSIPISDLNLISHRYRKVLELTKNKDILEVGLGSVIAKKELLENCNFYIGMDLVKENLDNCKDSKLSGDFNLVGADAHKLPFESNSFDMVIALAMIYYLNIEDFLEETARVLKPGGSLFFCTSNKDVPGFNPSPFTKDYFSVDELNVLLIQKGYSPEFEGAFKKSSSTFYLVILAFVKENLKKIIFKITGNTDNWLLIRSFYKGKKVLIPSALKDFPECNEREEIIDPSKKDLKHRIIYCHAKSKLSNSTI